MKWAPNAEIVIDEPNEIDGHIEIVIRAAGVVPNDRDGKPLISDAEFEELLPRIATVRRYMGGVLARFALAFGEPIAMVAAAHGCGPAPSAMALTRFDSSCHRKLPGELLRRYRDEFERVTLGRYFIRGYATDEDRLYWPMDSCGVQANGVVTPTRPGTDWTIEPEVYVTVPNWHGKREAKWWTDQIRQVLDEIGADT